MIQIEVVFKPLKEETRQQQLSAKVLVTQGPEIIMFQFVKLSLTFPPLTSTFCEIFKRNVSMESQNTSKSSRCHRCLHFPKKPFDLQRQAISLGQWQEEQ